MKKYKHYITELFDFNNVIDDIRNHGPIYNQIISYKV